VDFGTHSCDPVPSQYTLGRKSAVLRQARFLKACVIPVTPPQACTRFQTHACTIVDKYAVHLCLSRVVTYQKCGSAKLRSWLFKELRFLLMYTTIHVCMFCSAKLPDR
jgi:hypothetical protein